MTYILDLELFIFLFLSKLGSNTKSDHLEEKTKLQARVTGLAHDQY